MFYVSLLQGCVNLIFGKDENFNARLNHKFAFKCIQKSIKILKITSSICDESNCMKILTSGYKQIVSL